MPKRAAMLLFPIVTLMDVDAPVFLDMARARQAFKKPNASE